MFPIEAHLKAKKNIRYFFKIENQILSLKRLVIKQILVFKCILVRIKVVEVQNCEIEYSTVKSNIQQ
jgi:hypothetical protein